MGNSTKVAQCGICGWQKASLTVIVAFFSISLVPFRKARAQNVLGNEACVTHPPDSSALNSSGLERLHVEKSYVVFETALPRRSFAGHGKKLAVTGEEFKPVEQHLKGPTAKREDVMKVLEHIIPQEFGMGKCPGDKPCPIGWKDVNKRQANIMYMSSLVDLKPFRRRVYIDGGSRDWESSIGGWFNPVYPQAELFDHIYAFDIDPQFGDTYKDKANTTFLPCPMSIKDEKLVVYGSSMMTIEKTSWVVKATKARAEAYAIDFSNWLLANVSPDDFVVMKLDIEGAEHELLMHLMQTKAIYLIDELFVECHYNKWSRARKDKTRKSCVVLLQGLRNKNVVLHEWF